MKTMHGNEMGIKYHSRKQKLKAIGNKSIKSENMH